MGGSRGWRETPTGQASHGLRLTKKQMDDEEPAQWNEHTSWPEMQELVACSDGRRYTFWLRGRDSKRVAPANCDPTSNDVRRCGSITCLIGHVCLSSPQPCSGFQVSDWVTRAANGPSFCKAAPGGVQGRPPLVITTTLPGAASQDNDRSQEKKNPHKTPRIGPSWPLNSL